MTNYMAAIFMAIMLLAQIGTAQHSVVHFEDHAHYEYPQDHEGHSGHADHDDHEGDRQENRASQDCQICLIVKSMSLALNDQNEVLHIFSIYDHSFFTTDDLIISDNQHRLYHARAPPAFLI